jgi:hypothetical protein
MTKSIGYVVVCLLGLMGCDIDHYGDDCEDYEHEDDRTPGSGARAGSPSATGGSSAEGGVGGSASGGATGGSGASAGAAPAPNTTCEEERDCDPGFNCDLEARECVATDAETCPELESETTCSNRRDCMPVYGGINCSCGQDCECKGGEPGCICESFDFVACQAAE